MARLNHLKGIFQPKFSVCLWVTHSHMFLASCQIQDSHLSSSNLELLNKELDIHFKIGKLLARQRKIATLLPAHSCTSWTKGLCASNSLKPYLSSRRKLTANFPFPQKTFRK